MTTKTVKISDLLTEEQVEDCCKIINNQWTTGGESISHLKAYLGKFRLELEEKGVDSDYLAYQLIFLTTQEQ